MKCNLWKVLPGPDSRTLVWRAWNSLPAVLTSTHWLLLESALCQSHKVNRAGVVGDRQRFGMPSHSSVSPSQHRENASASVWFFHTLLKPVFVKSGHVLLLNCQCAFFNINVNDFIHRIAPTFFFSVLNNTLCIKNACFWQLQYHSKGKKITGISNVEDILPRSHLAKFKEDNKIYLHYCVSISMFWRSLL